MHGFWAPLDPSDAVGQGERAPTPKRVRLFGRRNSSRGASFVTMMQTSDLRNHNNIACRARLYAARLRTRNESRETRAERIVIMPVTVWR
jgi:hypothetical protein